MNRSIVISAAALVSLSGLVLAQDRKPLPPPPAPAQDVGTERLANMDQFLEAYRRAGSPRLLIATDVIPYADAGASASRALTMADTLGARMEDLFHDPEVIVINAQAQGLLGAQQREALRGNDEAAAARILARDVGADMVFTLRLTEKPERGNFSANYVITDLRQGTTLGRYAFDMLPDPETGDLNNYRLSEYARAIAKRMSTQFAEAFPAAGQGGAMRRWTLRVTGDYNEDDLAALQDALNSAQGVRTGSVNLRGEERSTATVVTTLDMLSSQDVLGVRQTLRHAIADQLVMGSEVLDVKGQTINLRLSPLGLTDRERALAGGPATSRNKAERDALAAAYAKASRPTIAVMINRAQVQDSAGESNLATQPQNAPLQQGEGTNIIIGERVGVGHNDFIDPITARIIDQELKDQREERLEQREVDLRSVENRMVERLTSLGLSLKDVAPAQAAMTKAGETAGKEWTDRELAAVLGAKSGAEVVLSGVAKVTRSRPGAFPVRIELTVRAYRTADGVILGASTTSREVASAGATLEQALDALSAEATGRLAGQLSDTWAK